MVPGMADRRGRTGLQRHARHHIRPVRQLVHLWPQWHVLDPHEPAPIQKGGVHQDI